MKIETIRIKNLVHNSIILSIPGFVSIFLSLLAIPVHLKIAGLENYGNYLLFHILLTLSQLFNAGISKSVVIGSNFESKNIKNIAYDAIKYTFFIFLLILLLYYPLSILVNNKLSNEVFYIELLFFGFGISIFYLTFEGILQAYKNFKIISFINFVFYSLSLSLPSLLLLFLNNLKLIELLFLSITIKVLVIVYLFFYLLKNNLITKNKKKKFYNYFKKNSPWLSLNSLLTQIYDIFDKYLIKIFLGAGLMAIYSIPQQITGKLTILSKSFSTFLLPNLKNKNSDQFIFSINLFLKYIPLIIFLLFPIYPIILKFWLGNEYSTLIHDLTKIFSLIAIFSCSSHILITKYESIQSSKTNFKIEFIFLPFFCVLLFYLCIYSYSIIFISSLVLLKEIILNFCRLYFLKLKATYVYNLYLNLIFFPILLILSFNNMIIFYLFLFSIIFYTFSNVKFNN